jgi:hypothetical protein
MKYLFIILLCLSGLSCANPKSTEEKKLNFDTAVSVLKFHAETVEVNGGYGYMVFVNGKKFIFQETIPAVEGNMLFKTKEDALKVGKLVVKKMTQSTDFPSVTVDELKELKIIE